MSHPVGVHSAALVDAQGNIVSTLVPLPPSSQIILTLRDDIVDVEFKCPVEVTFKLLDPKAVAIGLFDKFVRLLLIYSIPGDPTKHKRGQLVKLAPRFTMLQIKNGTSAR